MKDRETHDHREHKGTGYTRRGWTVSDQSGERRARLSWQLAGASNRDYITLVIDANAGHPATGFELSH